MATNGQEGEAATTWTVADTKNLTIQGEQRAGTLVVKAAGRVDGANANDFQHALESLLNENESPLVLDFEDLAYISSAGLRVILLVSKQLQRKNTKFGVCSLSSSISEVFQISGFDKIIPTYTAQADAISAFDG